MKTFSLVSAAFCLFLSTCSFSGDQESEGPYPVLGIEPLRDVSVIDSPDEALVHWARKSRRHLTVIHMGMHGGMASLSADKTDKLKSLVKKGRWEELASSRNRGDNSLITPQNYLSAAAALGIVSKVFWVLPDRMLEYADAERRVRQFLTIPGSPFPQADIESMTSDRGCVSGMLQRTAVSICSIETLPPIDGPVLLDLDIDSIGRFSAAKNSSPLRGFKTLYDLLAARKLRVASATIAGSDMLSRSLYRYLGEQAAEALRNPDLMKAPAPPDLWLSRDSAAWAFTQNEDTGAAAKDLLKAHPSDAPLVLFGAVASALRGKEQTALETLENLCVADRTTCPALLYVAGELKKKQRSDAAETFLLKALALRPDWPEALREYGDLLYEKKEYRNALQRYQSLAATADGFSLQIAIGDCFYFLEQKRDALSHYQNGLSFYNASGGYRLTDRERGSLTRLVRLYDEQKDADRATSVRRILEPGRSN